MPDELKALTDATGQIQRGIESITAEQAEQKRAIASMQERLRAGSLSMPGLESDEYRKKYSLARAAQAIYTGDYRHAQFECGVSDELKRRLSGEVENRVFSTLAGGTGGFLVPPEVMPGVVQALEGQAKLRALGVTVVKPSGYPYSIVKETSTASASAASELGTYSEQSVTFGKIDLLPKKVAIRFVLTQEQVMWANPQTEQVIDRKIGVGIANEEDRQIINGGLLPSEMLGILNTTGILTTAGIATSQLFWGDINRAWSKLMNANADQSGGAFGVLMHSIEWAKLARQLVRAVSTTQAEDEGASFTGGFPFMSEKRFKEITGFLGAHNTIVPKTLGAGATESFPITGNFRDYYLAEFGGMVLTKSDTATDGTYNAFTQDLVHVKAVVWRDGAAVRPSSFHSTTGIVLGPA
jgi:HK97 family phage major capsid protein